MKEKNIKYISAYIIISLIFMGITSTGPVNGNTENTAQKHRAARSVHLWYKAPDSALFYNEMTVEKSYPGSYFMACGFNHGYFGIQELNDRGDKVVIFSVWDPGKQNNPNSVEQDRMVKVLHEGKDVRVSRFGGEGTGGKSMFDYQWKIGQTYKFCIKATIEGDRTAYAAYFYLNEENSWKHLATFATITGGEHLKGYYSFVEDFRRNYTSAENSRRASYGNGWVKTPEGQWIALTEATFTADRTPTLNIDAGIENNRFFLITGGDTKNNTPLRTKMNRLPEGLNLPKSTDNNKNNNQTNSKDTNMTERKIINTDKAPKAIGPYSQAMLVGNTLYIAGQIGIDPSTGKLIAGSTAEQTKQAFENIKNILAAVDMELKHLVQVQVFLADIADFAEMNQVYASYFTGDFPTRAAFQAANLPAGAKVEILATAIK